MEQNIIYDLLEGETVKWCVKSNKKVNSQIHIVTMLAANSIGLAAMTIFVFGFLALISGLPFKYWGVLLGISFVMGCFVYSRFTNADETSELFYYVTNKRIITLRKSSKKRLVRAQLLDDVKKIDVRIMTNNRASFFFKPAKNIKIYQVENYNANGRKDIYAHPAMAFLSAYDAEELINILKTHEHIELDID